MKMDEICSRPGAAPLRELFKDALGAQEAEVATAQVMLDVLQQFAAEVEEEEMAAEEGSQRPPRRRAPQRLESRRSPTPGPRI